MDAEEFFMPKAVSTFDKFWIRSIHVKKLHPAAKCPTRASHLAAGYDLYALNEEGGGWDVKRGDKATFIPTGIAIDMTRMDQHMVGLIFPRSGLGHKKGLVLGNSVGVIDQDYHGEILISAWNRGQQDEIFISPGERIAQIVFMPIFVPPLIEVDDFVSTTERGAGGFGSTGG